MDNSGTGGGLRAGFGLFGGGGGGGAGAAGGSVSDYSQPDLSRVPLTGMSPLSPYLNLDPRYLVHDNDEFILPTGANKTRGRFELAFFTIGGCCMTGAAIGAVNGLRLGLKETRDMNWSKPRNVHFGEDADSWRPQFLLALVKLSLLCWIVLVYRPPPLATDRVKWFWFIMYLLQGPWLQIILNMVTRQGALWANTLGSLALLYSTFGVVIEKVRGAEDDLNTMAAGSLTGLLYKSTAGLRGAARGGFIGLTLTGLYALYNNWDHIKGTSARHSL